MYQKKTKKTVSHSPTLKTIRMVENILKNLDLYTIKFSDLKKQLPKQVNHNTLKEIIRYLEQSGKVYVGIDGITWIYNPSKKLAKAISEGVRVEPEDLRKILQKLNKEHPL
jgi:hypothetical protein